MLSSVSSYLHFFSVAFVPLLLTRYAFFCFFCFNNFSVSFLLSLTLKLCFLEPDNFWLLSNKVVWAHSDVLFTIWRMIANLSCQMNKLMLNKYSFSPLCCVYIVKFNKKQSLRTRSYRLFQKKKFGWGHGIQGISKNNTMWNFRGLDKREVEVVLVFGLEISNEIWGISRGEAL